MRRPTHIALVVVLMLAAGLATAGCTPDLQAKNALQEGNAALAQYAKAEGAIADKIAQAAVVQPTPEGVKPGLALLKEVAAAMPARHKAALMAKAKFLAFKAASSDAKEKAYADHAIALAEGLLALDTGTTALTKNMTGLYRAVAENSSDTRQVSSLADAVTKGQTTYDSLRAQVKKLSDDADAYYQQNLAGAK